MKDIVCYSNMEHISKDPIYQNYRKSSNFQNFLTQKMSQNYLKHYLGPVHYSIIFASKTTQFIGITPETAQPRIIWGKWKKGKNIQTVRLQLLMIFDHPQIFFLATPFYKNPNKSDFVPCSGYFSRHYVFRLVFTIRIWGWGWKKN